MALVDYLEIAQQALAELNTAAAQPASATEPQSVGKPIAALADRGGASWQIGCWLRAKCERSKAAWCAEKFLYGDYGEWSDASGQHAISLEQFRAILDTSFEREMDGWRGLCLASDWPGSRA